jgi:hypothetical protein
MVTVIVGGQPVKLLLYDAGTKSYQNAFGAKWQVREVLAIYPAWDLRAGFQVDYTYARPYRAVDIQRARRQGSRSVVAPGPVDDLAYVGARECYYQNRPPTS